MRIVITVLLVLFLPLVALMIVLLVPVCQALLNANISAPDHEYLVGVAMAVRDFSLGNDAAALPLGEDYRTAITPDAIQHLLDVRTVFLVAEIATLVVLVAVIALCAHTVRCRGTQQLARPFIIGGALPLVAAALLGGVVAIDFSAFFTWMHSLFFAAGTWTFPADSLLIRALPTGFWISCTVLWAVSMVLFCLLALALGILLKKRGLRVKATDLCQESSKPK